MPLLLAPAQAPTLRALLAQANTASLSYDFGSDDAGADAPIQGLGSLSQAGASELSFLSNPRWAGQLASCQAAAVLLSSSQADKLPAQPAFQPVFCDDPYLFYALVSQWFDRHRRPAPAAGVHPSAVVAADADVDATASIGPHCVIEAGARVGAGSRLGAGCVVGPDATIGRDCILHPRATLYGDVHLGDRVIVHTGAVLGADGFGFAPDMRPDRGGWVKIAQLGGVRVGHDVEIGANTTIDCGAIEPTRIGNGVKLDNQIMIAHNVEVGDHTAIAACVGVAGSTRIGRRCTIGGAAMISGHLVLADDVHVSGGTAITSSVVQPGRYTGVYPYAPHAQWQRNAAVLGQLGQLRRRVRTMEQHTGVSPDEGDPGAGAGADSGGR